MENKEIARVLWETADLMEIAGEDSFRIRSYRNGATAVEGYPERIADILRDPERKVTDIPGIGKGLAVVLAEIVASAAPASAATRCCRNSRPPRSSFSRSRASGPKSIALIFEHYRVSTIDELERLCQEQKLRGLPRMGAKLEEKVLRSIAQYRQRTGRYLLSYAEGVAAELIDVLRQVPGVEPSRRPAACGADARRSAISICWSPAPTPPTALDTIRRRIRAWRKCSRAAKTRPAPKWATRACRWTCARCRPTASAPPCSTSPAARTTTSPSARAP